MASQILHLRGGFVVLVDEVFDEVRLRGEDAVELERDVRQARLRSLDLIVEFLHEVENALAEVSPVN